MIAAEERALLLEPVPDDMNAAVVAVRREHIDSALEAVEGIGVAFHNHLERFVVVVAAGFAFGHDCLAWEVVSDAITDSVAHRFQCAPALMANLPARLRALPPALLRRFELLKLPKQVNEPLGDGLLKVVLCTEPSPDGGLKLLQRSVARPIVSRDDMLPDRVQSV
jgi:hypothetical protein